MITNVNWSNIGSPSKFIVALDTNDADSWNNNGAWYAPPGSPSVYGAPGSAGFRHGNTCNIAFADGHVEGFKNVGAGLGVDAAYIAREVTNDAGATP